MPSYYGTKYMMSEVDPVIAKICAGEKITMEDVAEVVSPPYPWCDQPQVCIAKGYCPRDPNCGE